ncbi:MAG TPA: hypothetical protein ENK26_00475 [Gammaproteobacteria bacterium]|nr:hypothetical protein [Gammaproteobacteria bacterium]
MGQEISTTRFGKKDFDNFRDALEDETRALERLPPEALEGLTQLNIDPAERWEYLGIIETCPHIARIPGHPPAEHDIAVYHSIARVKIPDQVSFSFEDSHSDLVFHKAMEKFNFRDVEPGEILAECRENHDPKIVATREDGEDVTREYFQCRDNKLLIRKPVMLSMLTRDERVIRQDCLCYLMERLEH